MASSFLCSISKTKYENLSFLLDNYSQKHYNKYITFFGMSKFSQMTHVAKDWFWFVFTNIVLHIFDKK